MSARRATGATLTPYRSPIQQALLLLALTPEEPSPLPGSWNCGRGRAGVRHVGQLLFGVLGGSGSMSQTSLSHKHIKDRSEASRSIQSLLCVLDFPPILSTGSFCFLLPPLAFCPSLWPSLSDCYDPRSVAYSVTGLLFTGLFVWLRTDCNRQRCPGFSCISLK